MKAVLIVVMGMVAIEAVLVGVTLLAFWLGCLSGEYALPLLWIPLLCCVILINFTAALGIVRWIRRIT